MARVNFEANSALIELLEGLRKQTDSTKKGVVVGSLQLMKWALEQERLGGKVVAVFPDKDGYVKEFQLPLQNK